MSEQKLHQALALIDQANAQDPSHEMWQGEAIPKELLYSHRMSEWLGKLDPAPSEARQIAARAQHIRRWTVPRDQYPEGREGYLRWRKYLYRFHADQAVAIMREVGYEDALCEQVKKMIGKEGIKRDADVQCIEDVACLVFLEHYLPPFAQKYDEDKLIDIVRKTWKKMSGQAHAAALGLALPDDLGAVVAKALAVQDA